MDSTALLGGYSTGTLIAIAVAAVVVMAVLYLARERAQTLLRDSAAWVATTSRRLGRGSRRTAALNKQRARRAVIQLAREASEQRLTRQERRLAETLSRDLASFPHLHRQLHEQIRRVDEDYRSTVEAPPTPPEWLEAIETITRLPAREDPSVGRMLEDLRATLDRSCHEALLAYRAASQRRHRVLKRMQPLWRRMDRTLASLDQSMRQLQKQTDRLDRQIDEYSGIVTARGSVVRRVAARLVPRSLLALLALAGATAAGVITFQMIATPLATMGASAPLGSGIAGVPLSQLMAASLLVLLALGGGVLLDTLRITHLFPESGWLDTRVRRILAIGAAVLVTAMLLAAGSLAGTQDYLASLAGPSVIGWEPGILVAERPIFEPAQLPSFQWLPAAIHSLIATGLAVLVAMVAVPLEALLRQGRAVTLGATAVVFDAVTLVTDLTAILAIYLRRLLAGIYDLVIILPLGLEAGYHRLRGNAKEQNDTARPEPEPAAGNDPPPRDRGEE